MKTFHFSRMLTIALAMFLGVAAINAQKDVSAVMQKGNDKWAELFNSGDAKGLASLYTEDAHLMPPNHPVVAGRAAIEEFWTAVMSFGLTAKLTTKKAEAYGKVAVEEGSGVLYAGDAVVDEIKYVLEWKKVKGEWKINKDIYSSNNPLPEE